MFCCVTDIQEFYELTLLDESKSVQQKTAETIRIADKWEASDGPITPTFAQNDVSKAWLKKSYTPMLSFNRTLFVPKLALAFEFTQIYQQ